MNFNKSLVLAIALITAGIANIQAGEPYFHWDGSIRFATNLDYCGGITFKPLPGVGQVMLESYVYYAPIGQTDPDTTDGIIGKYGSISGLDDGGKRFRYDRAGGGPKTHYRIYCKSRKRTIDYWNKIPCANVLDQSALNVMHNRSCAIGDSITGPGIGRPEGYDYLHMNKGGGSRDAEADLKSEDSTSTK